MDVPKGPKTTDEARALPEDDGMIKQPEKPLPLAGVYEGDTILMFLDSDGRRMQVEFDGERWVKVEMPL